MKTQNVIQTVANVIKITSLKKGDVVKMIESTYSTPESYYAVVLDMLNDGEKTYLELLKYKKSYNSVNAEIKLYEGTTDISLFPTSIEELKEHFGDCIKSIEREIIDDKEKLQKKIESLEKAKEFTSGELSKTLSEVEYSEIEQSKFIQLQREKQEKLKALSEEE